MSMAYFVAMRSKDKSTHHGAVIISNDDHAVLSTGYNSFPRWIDDDVPARQERPEKYLWFEHAERNAIYNAAKHGIGLNFSTIYVTGVPCMDCARAIVQAGIRQCVMCARYLHLDRKSWVDNQPKTVELFEEAKVDYRFHSEIVRDISILNNGNWV